MLLLHRDERGQSLVIVLSLITIMFLLGSSLAVHGSVALRSTRASEGQGDDFYAADAATELGIWWQRNGKAGNPPAQTINGVTTSTTISTAGGGGGGACPADATPEWLGGLESGVFFKTITTNTNQYALLGGFYDKAGDVTIVTSPVRTGNYALRVHTTPTTGAFVSTRFATPYPPYAVMRFSAWIDALPSGDVDVGRFSVTGGSNHTTLHVFYKASSQKWALGWGWANPTVIQESTVTAVAGAWASFDVRVSANNQNPRTADWYVNDVEQTSLSATDTANATAVTNWTLGYPPSPIFDFTAYFDDIVLSRDPDDFPLGDIKVAPLLSDSMGTHNDATKFQNNDNSAINATTYQRVDETPMTATADYIKQIAYTTGGEYISLGFQDTTETCIRGASIVAALHAGGTQTDNFAINTVANGINDTVFAGDVSNTTLWYVQGMVSQNTITPGVGPWTQSVINGLTARVGMSTDINAVPYLDAMLMEYGYRPAGGGGPATVTIVGTGGGSTVTTDYLDAGAGIPTLDTWTVTK
jgi:hypothetical protein